MKNSMVMVTALMLFNVSQLNAQKTRFGKYNVEAVGVSLSEEKMRHKEALKAIKDPTIEAVDEPTFIRINEVDFRDGTIEVKVLSKLLPNAPEFARGFIGIAFRINDNNTKYESIYIRPANAWADDQVRRNHSIQYYSYPDYKFDRLRREAPEKYEAYTDLEMNKWISMRIEVKGPKAQLFLNGNQQPSLVVNDLKHGANAIGAIGLWVDIGTEGYFSDLQI
jgi:hypothetical protein